MLFKGLPIPWWHILRNPITSAHNHPITHIPMDHDGPSWDTEIHGIIHPHDGYIYIYIPGGPFGTQKLVPLFFYTTLKIMYVSRGVKKRCTFTLALQVFYVPKEPPG
jgi:hypothetical protein